MARRVGYYRILFADDSTETWYMTEYDLLAMRDYMITTGRTESNPAYRTVSCTYVSAGVT